MYEIILTANQANMRLDKVLQKVLKSAPQSFIYKMLRKKNITLNHQKAEGIEKTKEGDSVQFFFSEETYFKMQGIENAQIPKIPKNFPKIQVLYEDQNVCVFVKPQGVLSQKATENDYSVNEWVIVEAIQKGFLKEEELKTFRPSVCNRLDRNTCGIMVAGFSLKGLQILSDLLKERTASKFYYAVVVGEVKEKKDLESFLVKNEKTNQVKIYKKDAQNVHKDAKKIHTVYEPLRYNKETDLSLVKVDLLTGRSHQIRAQLAAEGHPILGDTKYGNERMNQKFHQSLQCLCAYQMTFPTCDLPGVSGKTFEIDCPWEV